MRSIALGSVGAAALTAVVTVSLALAPAGSDSPPAPAAVPASAPAAAPAAAEEIWFDDSLPAGAAASPNWSWTSSEPPPFSGSVCAVSEIAEGIHQYQFENADAKLTLKPGDEFFINVMLDPENPPEMLMLQFFDGTWEHRAYWGKRAVAAGVEGTASQRYMGPLPAAGEWTQLQVPSWRAGLDGSTISGLAVTLFDGRAAWDRAGRIEKSPYFPTGTDWETVSFADVGWDDSGLAGLLFYLQLTGSRTFLVLKDGKILVEAYWEGWDKDTVHPLYSATKGHTSLLVGNAQHRGELSLEDAVIDHLGAGWSGATPAQEAAITVRHLVTMTAGLTDDLDYEAPAGEQWRYAGTYYQNFEVLLAATGKTNTQLTREEIVEPTGMENTYYSDGEGWVQTTNRDCGRYGLMMLAGGQWNGGSIVHDKKYLGEAINTSQDMNPTYGYLWWLNGKSSYMMPGDTVGSPGPLMPDAPSEAYLAAGAFHQYVMPIPSHDLVIVRMGSFNFVPASEYLNEIAKAVVAMAPNTAPIVSGLPDAAIDEDGDTGAILFSVSDRQTTPYVLTVTAESDNPALVPPLGIALAGDAECRALTVTPAADAYGTATITITVTDTGGLSATSSFTLTVNS
ncbi:MAG: serine hydrolase, partial [Planctomycetota bacterium]